MGVASKIQKSIVQETTLKYKYCYKRVHDNDVIEYIKSRCLFHRTQILLPHSVVPLQCFITCGI